MTRIHQLFCIFFLLSSGPALLPALQAQATVTYIANEGFLIEGGGKKVLIDALFDGIGNYARPSAQMQRRLEQAEPPFDAVDLILATHFHDDHFSPGPLRRHLEANPKAALLTTPQALGRLDEQGKAMPAGQALSAYPEEGHPQSRSIAGIRIDILNLHHGRGRNPPIQNLGFIIHIGGLRVLHIGDTEANAGDFRKYSAILLEPVDLALLPAWYLTNQRWTEVVRSQIRPRYIGVMHLATPGAPASYFGSDGSRARRIQAIRKGFPEAEIFTSPGQQRRFSH